MNRRAITAGMPGCVYDPEGCGRDGTDHERSPVQTMEHSTQEQHYKPSGDAEHYQDERAPLQADAKRWQDERYRGTGAIERREQQDDSREMGRDVGHEARRS